MRTQDFKIDRTKKEVDTWFRKHIFTDETRVGRYNDSN